jgi:hypothetical protein
MKSDAQRKRDERARRQKAGQDHVRNTLRLQLVGE